MRKTALLALLTLIACDPSTGRSSDIDRQDAGAGGKADGASAVELVAADEALGSKTLRNQLCDAIAGAHPWTDIAVRDNFADNCLDHDYTITEFATSKLYAHLDDGDAMTLQMKVHVEAGSLEWDTRLVREFSNFEFRWTAVVDTVPVQGDRDKFIADLADDMGEFFTPEDFPENFKMLDELDDLPDAVEQRAISRVEEISEEMKQAPHDTSSAGFADIPPHEILREGEVVGYVVEVWFFIDHPLFDGGGTTLYFNPLGEIIDEVDWFG